jgi:hypothetical protein
MALVGYGPRPLLVQAPTVVQHLTKDEAALTGRCSPDASENKMRTTARFWTKSTMVLRNHCFKTDVLRTP